MAIATSLPAAELQLASPFGENMVLQRQMPVPVWGWADAGRSITVRVAGAEASATVGRDGRWRCDLPALKAGGPHIFTVGDGSTTITYTNVLIGEVWICCGQSNMAMSHGGIPEIKQLVADTVAAQRPVRALEVRTMISFDEEERCLSAKWKTTPADSAVAAAFSCSLQEEIDVPVAVVTTCWGSSSIEGWMPRDMAGQLPHFQAEMDEKLGDDYGEICRSIIEKSLAKGRIINEKDYPELAALLKENRGRSANIFARTRPNLLYNAMLHPLIPMACRGMVYYQGEQNTASYDQMVQYGTTQPLWIQRLRQGWGRDDWYFLGVMLPGYGKTIRSGPGYGDLEAVDAHSWAILRDSQLEALKLPHTSVVNSIDLGDEKNVHPKDKLPIGQRLALLARRDVLGEADLLAAGPMFAELVIKGRKVIISFKDADGLTTTDGQAPRAFWVSADGTDWLQAEAQIKGEQVVLTAPKGVAPKHVRYAFSAMPDVNLVNKAGLPAYPFRSE